MHASSHGVQGLPRKGTISASWHLIACASFPPLLIVGIQQQTSVRQPLEAVLAGGSPPSPRQVVGLGWRNGRAIKQLP